MRKFEEEIIVTGIINSYEPAAKIIYMYMCGFM